MFPCNFTIVICENLQVDFSVTPDALVSQLVVIVAAAERPDLELQRRRIQQAIQRYHSCLIGLVSPASKIYLIWGFG